MINGVCAMTMMQSSSEWMEVGDGYLVLRLRVQPGAKKSKVVGPHAAQLKVAVAAPPVDGKANATLLSWLAKELGLRQSDLEILSGQSGRDKRIKVTGSDPDAVIKHLSAT